MGTLRYQISAFALTLVSFSAGLPVEIFAEPEANLADKAGFALPAAAENGAYVVILAGEPAITYGGGLIGFKATKPTKSEKFQPTSARVRAYAKILDQKHDRVLSTSGVAVSSKTHSYRLALNGFAARLTHDQAIALSRRPDVIAVLPDRKYYLSTDNSPEFLGLTAPGGVYAHGYTGEGVIVGIIDSGIWPEHPSFKDDGSYTDPYDAIPTPRPTECDFGNTTHNSKDAPFSCNNKLIAAYKFLAGQSDGVDSKDFDSARDADGHGSHIASIAAGNAGVAAQTFGVDRGPISGIAPRAHLIAYKVCGVPEKECALQDILSAIEQAIADTVDVINISLAGGQPNPNAPPPRLDWPAEVALLNAAHAGINIANIAGNAGPDYGTILTPAVAPWLTAVGASTQDRWFQGSVRTGDETKYFGASITAGTAEVPLVDGEDAGDELCRMDRLDEKQVKGNVLLCLHIGMNTAVMTVSKDILDAGGVGMILYNDKDLPSPAYEQDKLPWNYWVPTVHISNSDGKEIKKYIDNNALPLVQLQKGESTAIDAPGMYRKSSRGPNWGFFCDGPWYHCQFLRPIALDLIKPDVVAPGVNILGALSPSHYRPWAPDQEFGALSGTSMASPHVAGVFALLKQVRSDWSPARIKSAIMTTAWQGVMNDDGKTPTNPFDIGAGHIRPGGWPGYGSIFDPGLVYDIQYDEYLAFLCDAQPSALSILGHTPLEKCEELRKQDVSLDAADLNLPSIGVADVLLAEGLDKPRVRIVSRKITNVASRFQGKSAWRVKTESPPGYKVRVSPHAPLINKNETREITIRITNRSPVPVGEWRFGSLTWADKLTGDYVVRSPIAIRAVKICDLDVDGVVDKIDIQAIGTWRGIRVPPAPVQADFDGDKIISVNDARYCVGKCDKVNCELVNP